MIAYSIEQLLPHAGKLMLLDHVLTYDDESMSAQVTVRGDGLFGDNTGVPAWLGIEYMAQTVAAHGGLMCRLAGKPLNPGFLLGTRRYHCNVSRLNAGAVLIVTVKRLIQDQGLGVFDCRVTGDGVEISAKLSVYQPDTAINRVITK